MSIDDYINNELMGKLITNKTASFYDELIALSDVMDLFKTEKFYAELQPKFLSLFDSGSIFAYLELDNLPKNIIEGYKLKISKYAGIMRNLKPEFIDLSNKNHLYSIFFLADSAATGDLEILYAMNNNGKKVFDTKDALLHDFRRFYELALDKKNRLCTSKYDFLKVVNVDNPKDITKFINNITNNFKKEKN